MMNIIGWLTVNNRGTVRMTKTQPNLQWNEVSIKLNLNLPDEMFNRPKLRANITIPKEAAMPTEITAETIEDCKDVIKQVTGLEMHISLIKHEEEKPEE